MLYEIFGYSTKFSVFRQFLNRKHDSLSRNIFYIFTIYLFIYLFFNLQMHLLWAKRPEDIKLMFWWHSKMLKQTVRF